MNKTVKQGTDKARDDRLTKEETTMTDDGWRREEEEERKQKAGEREREREREKKKNCQSICLWLHPVVSHIHRRDLK